MGDKVNVVVDGKVTPMDEDQAEILVKSTPGARYAGAGDNIRLAKKVVSEERTDTIQQKGTAAGEGLLDGWTGGLFGQIASAVSPEYGEKMRERGTNLAAYRAGGELLSVASPAGVTKLAARAGESLAARTASKAAGYLGEGMVLGAGSTVSQANVTGDDLTIEGMVEGIGVGGVLNAGFGALTDKAMSVFTPKAATAAAGAEKTYLKDVTKSAGRTGGETPLTKAARAKVKLENAEGALQTGIENKWAKQGDEFFEATAAERAANETAADAGQRAATAEEKRIFKAAEEARNKATKEYQEAKAALDQHPEYVELRSFYNAERKAAAANNATVKKEVEAYATFASPKGVDAVVKGYEKAQNTIRTKLQNLEAGVDARPLEEALDSIARLKRGYRDMVKNDAYEALHVTMSDVNAKVAKAAGDVPLPKLPKQPGEMMPLTPELPEKLSDFGKQHADSIERMAKEFDAMGSTAGQEVRQEGIEARMLKTTSQQQLDKLALSLGLEPGVTAAETLASIHGSVKNAFKPSYSRAAEEAQAALLSGKKAPVVIGDVGDDITALGSKVEKAKFENAGAEVDRARGVTGPEELRFGDDMFAEGKVPGAARAAKPEGSIFDQPVEWAKYGAQNAASRMVDVGGWKGAILRAMAGGAAGAALDGVEGAVFGATALSAKMSVMGKIAGFFAKAEPVLKASGRFASVMAAKWPSGEADSTNKGFAEQTLDRMNDVYQVRQSGPDMLYNMVKPLMGVGGDVAFKTYAQMGRVVGYLADTAPKDPGIDRDLKGSNWVPDMSEAYAWSHRFMAATQPMAYIERLFQGDGDPAGVEALDATWPALAHEVRNQAVQKDWSDLTVEQHDALGLLLKTPVNGLQHPDVAMIIQGQYLQGMMNAQQGEQKPGGKPAQPNGRPPAVQSPVAGSDVSALSK